MTQIDYEKEALQRYQNWITKTLLQVKIPPAAKERLDFVIRILEWIMLVKSPKKACKARDLKDHCS